MSAFNVVRVRVKPGYKEDLLEAHRNAHTDMSGFRRGSLVDTGEGTYCFIGEWDDFESIVAARPRLIEMLDTFRATLEDFGDGLGVTDAVSGETVLEVKS